MDWSHSHFPSSFTSTLDPSVTSDSVYLAVPPQPTTRRMSRPHPTTFVGVYMWMLLIRALISTNITWFTFVRRLYGGFYFIQKHPPNGWLYANSFPKAHLSFPVAKLDKSAPGHFSRHTSDEPNSKRLKELSHLLRAAVVWLMEGLQGFGKGKTLNQKCEEKKYMAYLWPSAALYNLNCIVSFFCFLYVALYRLLHNKSYLPDL